MSVRESFWDKTGKLFAPGANGLKQLWSFKALFCSSLMEIQGLNLELCLLRTRKKASARRLAKGNGMHRN